ncbi:NADPH-dependent FMN reductase [Nonomuraea rhizosphaerae]|uniref:NADPH-dependent FMN reductase n=1 Tax=Nonomuraea rhizosphaerae TaxID=2665663 RepID=UPI001C5F1740|nr:NAD(P)H-dependent oxidoreductase [Nonomuraea rhizosphaerae]
MKIFGVAASLHAGSFINRLLEAVDGELPPGALLERWRGLGTIPPYSAGAVPEQVVSMLRLLDECDGVLVTAPEHSLLPAELGHALRWMATGGRLAGKHVAVMSASVRACGAMWAQAELFKQLSGAGAVVIGSELTLSPTCPHFDEQGRLSAPYLRDHVHEIIGRLCPAPLRAPALTATRLVLTT